MNVEALPWWKGVLLVSALMLLTMLLVAMMITVLVFLVRPYMKKHKKSDMAVFDWLQGHTRPWRNNFMLFITFLGNHKFLIPANLALLFYFLFVSKSSWFSVRIAAISLSSLGLMLLLKTLFRRKRPLAPLLSAAKGLSFPSGHAIMSVTFYGQLIYILFKTIQDPGLKIFLAVFLSLLIMLIGFSRVYLRVHYVSDVLAGFIVGLLWLVISLEVLNWLEPIVRGSGFIQAHILLRSWEA
jgi:membrane-associated phospholipid phosphatase